MDRRKQNRLRDYDYAQNGKYFVTICTKGHENLFGEIENVHKIRKECMVEHYVIMPNHIHIIVALVGADGNPPETTKHGTP